MKKVEVVKSQKFGPLTNQSLRDACWETLQRTISKETTPAEANAVAAQAREILRSIRTDLNILELSGRKPQGNLLTFTGQA